ncbi:hypothetical protein Val02_18370 [Virgisporangium aliadipatigenens]|uniref:Aminoglycoside phosphotransferase domain-containing protein n=1 Tax=Virgisporangium aliadipatigenens TaxID=741659 RepID=A0A8J4DPH9_9ACTN|nr:aminoglycoside phosphotransferase family protein [Virgisporangium aliadipatigenens]GIJ44951.1 hypothetical protein Val02_18370 [Virgisporangium aliadipatigenens]
MLAPPLGLSVEDLRAALAAHWRLDGLPLTYAPVGFGSHHWIAGSYFVTVDHVPAHDSLHAVLDAVRALDLDFVVAPLSTVDGASAVRIDGGFTVAVYPFVEGEVFDWGAWAGSDHRRAVLDMLVRLHAAPVAGLPADDFAIPHRDGLHPHGFTDTGPYASRAAALLAARSSTVRQLLDRYDALVGSAPAGRVFTHGEPHPGNTMRAPDGWRLVDWDTARAAPPERDLWLLDDPVLFDAYTAATGVPVRPAVLELYRVRWDVNDLAVCVERFRRPHVGDADDAETWEILARLLTA